MRFNELDETSESLYRRGATDGLPVVPPTDDRVVEMLRGTDLPRDHEFGRLGNRKGALTVETVAINGVMAGCTPVHMPVLVAGARAMAHPDSNVIQVSVSTGSWAYCWVVNGPVRDELGISPRFGPGVRANRAIGRALGLAYKNTAIIHPGEKDMGVQGNPFKYSLLVGENEEASPWDPVHVSEGFDADESTVTLGGPNGFGQYSTPAEASASDVLERIIYNTPPWMTGRERKSFRNWVIHGLAPDNATTLADAGFTKSDTKAYLCENDQLTESERYPGFLTRDDDAEVESIRTPRYEDPDLIKLPVVGASGRENVAMGPSLGGPVTVQIEFPDEWDQLRAEYAAGTERTGTDEEYQWLADPRAE